MRSRRLRDESAPAMSVPSPRGSGRIIAAASSPSGRRSPHPESPDFKASLRVSVNRTCRRDYPGADAPGSPAGFESTDDRKGVCLLRAAGRGMLPLGVGYEPTFTWSVQDSNLRQPEANSGALPTELTDAESSGQNPLRGTVSPNPLPGWTARRRTDDINGPCLKGPLRESNPLPRSGTPWE